jgi:GNAT superfamily N-acetyltransferase
MQARFATSRLSVARLHARDKGDVLRHLLDLTSDDRLLRFESVTSDDTLRKYVDGIDFERDCALGLRSGDGTLVGFAHIANYGECAELGISVDKQLRGLGCGERLMVDGLRWAKLSGFATFLVLTSKANHAMLGLAKKYGARTSYDGSSAAARIDVRALPESRLIEALPDVLATTPVLALASLPAPVSEPAKPSAAPEPLPELGLAA